MRPPAATVRFSTRVLFVAVAAIAGIVTMLMPTPAHASSYSPSSYASRLLSLVNQAREQNGLRPLTPTSGTGSVAAAWTGHLASVHSLSHNPNLQHDLETHGSSHWMTYGENVGQGQTSSPDGLFKAYMASPEHRDNILTSAYRYVGVAVVFTGRSAWNTFDFVDAYGSATTHQAPAPKPVHHAVTHHRAPAPVVHHVAAAPRPAAHPAKPVRHPVRKHAKPAKPAKRSGVHVKGFATRSPAPRPATETVLATAPVAAAPLTAPTGTPAPRAFLIGLAVLALAAVGRRWTLTASRV